MSREVKVFFWRLCVFLDLILNLCPFSFSCRNHPMIIWILEDNSFPLTTINILPLISVQPGFHPFRGMDWWIIISFKNRVGGGFTACEDKLANLFICFTFPLLSYSKCWDLALFHSWITWANLPLNSIYHWIGADRQNS